MNIKKMHKFYPVKKNKELHNFPTLQNISFIIKFELKKNMYTNFLFFLTICLFLIYICRKNNLIVDYKLENIKDSPLSQKATQ